MEDHPTLIVVMRRYLATRQSVEICGEAMTGQDAMNKVDSLHPAVVILDLGLPDMPGMDVVHHVIRHAPQTRVIVVSAQLDRRIARQAINAGAMGVVPKDEMFEELDKAILAVSNKHYYISATLS